MKTVKIVLISVFVLAIAVFFNREIITLKIMERTIEKNLTSNLMTNLPDGLHVYLCGAGSPMFDVKRSGPCTAIIAGNKVYVVDVGSSAAKILQQGRVPLSNVEAIFLTHFHSDHIDGLGELIMQLWANGTRNTAVPVIAPRGVEQVVAGFNLAYQQDDQYRTAHHGEATMPPSGSDALAVPFNLTKGADGLVVYEQDGLKVTAFKADHKPVDPAVGYRFDYKGRSVVISGDTVKSDAVAKFASGADLLLHEALSQELVMFINKRAKEIGRDNVVKITLDILDYHTTPVEAAETAQQAKVGHLVFNHIIPPLPVSTLESLFVAGVDEVYSGDFTLGKDGTFISLPVQSKDINIEELIW
tara:strand:+ start:669 stop:1742 length:1074 start_codon:yes stop_codon:yes gene_type:complete